MQKFRSVAILVVVVCGVFVVLSSPLYAQMKGAPVPFSADWGYYDEGERGNGGKYYAASHAVRVEPLFLSFFGIIESASDLVIDSAVVSLIRIDDFPGKRSPIT